MTLRPLSVVSLALFVGCGGGSAALPGMRMPIARGIAIMPDEIVAAALVERFELAHCEGDVCLDPFPLWAVTGIAVSDDRIALAGPGALLSVYEDRTWRTYQPAPIEGDEFAEQVALHAVAFTPDGERLIVAGSEGRIYELGPGGLDLVRSFDEGEDGDEPPTFSALVIAPDDDWFVLAAMGEIIRIHAGEVSRRTFDGTADRLISVGRPLEERLVVSGPFGGFVIDDAFGEESRERAFYTDDQLERMGEYSGCGTAEYDDRAMTVYERTEELLAEGLSPDEAAARAESETPARSENLPPPGLDIPRSGGPALERYLDASEEGRALATVVRAAPASGFGAVMVRRGTSIAVAVHEWPAPEQIWARLGARRFAATASSVAPVQVLDVTGDRLVAVGLSGGLASLAPGDDTLRFRDADPLLAEPTALRIVDGEHALVATAAARLVRVNLQTSEVRELAAPGGVLRAIEPGPDAAYAVGDEGLVVRVAGDAVTQLESGVGVDLTTLAVVGERTLWVAGDASTLVRLGAGAPHRWPRVSSERIDEIHVSADEIFARTSEGTVLRVDGERLLARPGLSPSAVRAARVAVRFAPHVEGTPWLARETESAVAVDTPDAVAPFAALSWDASHDRFPGGHAALPPFLEDGGLSWSVFYWQGGNCCEGGGDLEDGDVLVEMASGSGCGEEDYDCSPLTSLDLRHRLVSSTRGTAISIVSSGTGGVPRSRRHRRATR